MTGELFYRFSLRNDLQNALRDNLDLLPVETESVENCRVGQGSFLTRIDQVDNTGDRVARSHEYARLKADWTAADVVDHWGGSRNAVGPVETLSGGEGGEQGRMDRFIGDSHLAAVDNLVLLVVD